MNEIFSAKGKIYNASAPGRMDVMGGVADYSGSLVLQMPIKERVVVKLQKRQDGMFVCLTNAPDTQKSFTLPVTEIRQKSYQEIKKIFLLKDHWASYVIGCFAVLEREKSIYTKGVTLLIDSTIPWGKGVSSSAALEVSVMHAICKAYKIKPGKTELPVLCQLVENEIAGAACGLMDQLSVYLGIKNRLLPIICQPHQVFDSIKLPSGLFFTGIDSGVKHAVGGSSYSDVRTAAFMGYTIIAQLEGASVKALESARSKKQFDHLPFNGFLANISPSIFYQNYLSSLPELLSGSVFLDQYTLTIDSVTTVTRDKQYRVRVCALHPVIENFRIHLFRQLLIHHEETKTKEDIILMGELMYQSHMGYSDIGLGNETTDEIVNLVKEAGASSGVFGARITGGGSGGTVCILAKGKKGKQTVKEIHQVMEKRTGKQLNLFSGSSNGALTLKK